MTQHEFLVRQTVLDFAERIEDRLNDKPTFRDKVLLMQILDFIRDHLDFELDGEEADE